jgi:hypothetical protein
MACRPPKRGRNMGRRHGCPCASVSHHHQRRQHGKGIYGQGHGIAGSSRSIRRGRGQFSRRESTMRGAARLETFSCCYPQSIN